MILLLYRGYLGLQPLDVSGEIHHSFTKPCFESFIAKGILYIPISMDLIPSEFGEQGSILPFYKQTPVVYFRYFKWTLDEGMFDNIISKTSSSPENTYPQYHRRLLISHYITSAIMTDDVISESYLTGLIHADATLEQINNFTEEFGIGSGRPFIWKTIKDIKKLIKESIDKPIEFPRLIVNDKTHPGI